MDENNSACQLIMTTDNYFCVGQQTARGFYVCSHHEISQFSVSVEKKSCVEYGVISKFVFLIRVNSLLWPFTLHVLLISPPIMLFLFCSPFFPLEVKSCARRCLDARVAEHMCLHFWIHRRPTPYVPWQLSGNESNRSLFEAFG